MTKDADERQKKSPVLRKAVLTVRFCVIFFLFGILYYPAVYLVRQIAYPTLHQWLPSVFPTYNFVLESEAAYALQQKQDLSAVLLLFFVAAMLIYRTSNRRYEEIVSATEGFYTVGEGLSLWFHRFFVCDLLAVLIAPSLPYLLRYLLSILPEGTPDIVFALSYFTAVPDLLCGIFGGGASYLLSVAVLGIFAFFSSLHALDRYRVSWLSSFAQ